MSNMKELSPIVAFVYARPKHTKKMLDTLSKNKLAKDSILYIFSDNAKKDKDIENVKEVRKIIHSYENRNLFKDIKIEEATQNKGLARSVIEGITSVIEQYEKVIVLEDDLIVSETFLEYMNESLELYKENKKIWSISGYNLPIKIPKTYRKDVYVSYRGSSWSWATWKDRWNTVDWKVTDYLEFKHSFQKRKKLNRGGPDMAQMLDAQMSKMIDSWAIRWCYEQSKQDKYTIYPIKSLVINQGLDGSGTHSGITNSFDTQISNVVPRLEKEIKIDKRIVKKFYKKFDYGIKQKIKELFIIFRLKN